MGRLLLVTFLTFSLHLGAWAISPPIPAIRQPEDTALELEIDMSPRLMSLLTTIDGTLLPLLNQGPAPEWLMNGPINNDAKDWDDLNYDEQLKLLQHYAPKNPDVFFPNQTIAGLAIRDSIEILFPKATTLYGTHYSKGLHKVKLKKFLKGAIEYGSPTTMASVSLVELHVRSNLNAGRVYLDTLEFVRLMGLPPMHYHAHIVAPNPLNIQDSKFHRIAFLEFVRRINTIAEIIAIFEGSSINVKFDRLGNKAFAYLDGEDLSLVINSVLESGGESPYLAGSSSLGEHYQGRSLLGYASLRDSQTYDKDGLVGLEYRAIAHNSPSIAMAELLDRIQTMLLNGTYALPTKQLLSWILDTEGSMNNALLFGYYNSGSVSMMFKNMPNSLRPLFMGYPTFTQHFRKLAEGKNTELRMLLHDWSNDPLTFNQFWLKWRIRREQIRTIQRFKGDLRINVNLLMKEFLRTSGLAALFLESVEISNDSCESFLE